MPLPFSEKSLLYILTSLECIEKIHIYTREFNNAETFYNADDQQEFNATCHLMLTIGEEARKIDQTLKDEFSFIEWDNIAGLRNRIAHDYREIDYEIVFAICRNELSALKEAYIKMVGIIHPPADQLMQLLQQPYYRHLSYLIERMKNSD
jgi:uncharacterized protein with HEPN domain